MLENILWFLLGCSLGFLACYVWSRRIVDEADKEYRKVIKKYNEIRDILEKERDI